MATSSIGVPIVLTDEMADKIFAAMDRPAKKIEVKNKTMEFCNSREEVRDLVEKVKQCYAKK